MTDVFGNIEMLERDLWEAADNLRANSKLTSSDYFMSVPGVIFLRHAANRFDAAHRQIEASQREDAEEEDSPRTRSRFFLGRWFRNGVFLPPLDGIL